MTLQFLSDESGRRTAVQLSMEDWEKIKSRYPDIEDLSSDLPEWQKELLDIRLESARKNPERIRPGDELLEEL